LIDSNIVGLPSVSPTALGGGGFYTVIGGRGLYKFMKEPEYDIYGFGSLAYISWSGIGSSLSTVGYGLVQELSTMLQKRSLLMVS